MFEPADRDHQSGHEENYELEDHQQRQRGLVPIRPASLHGITPSEDSRLHSRSVNASETAGRSCKTRYPVSQKLFSVKSDEDEDPRILDNPFHRWLPDQVENVARRVACEYGLSNLEDLFVKAARVLKDPDPESWPTWPESERLTEEEMRLLQHERTSGFWDQPWPLQTTFLMLFVAATVQGWNQTGTNGANLTWWNDIGPSGTTSRPDGCGQPGDELIWPYAAVNAAPYLAASIGCWVSDPLINELRFGRRGAIMVSAILVFASAIGGSLTQHWYELLVCRIILGIGMGCKAAVVPVFAAEIAPAHLRGSLVMNWQVFDAFGIFLGFSANLVASKTGDSAWRWQIASSAIPAFALLWGVVFVCWDSPRFLMKHEERLRDRYAKRSQSWRQRYGSFNKEASQLPFWKRIMRLLHRIFRSDPALPYQSEAYKTLLLLREHPILAAKELMYAHCQLLVEAHFSHSSHASQPSSEDMDFSLRSHSSWGGRLKDLFTEDYIRREVYAAAVVMISQQLCGINVLIFYSSTLFCNTGGGSGGSHSLAPLLLSWGIGLTNFLCAFPAYWLIESRGRRWLLLGTLPILVVMMVGAALAFLIHQGESQRGIVSLFTFAFTVFYSSGLGPVPFTLSAEMFPLEHRMVGMSLAVSLNFFGAGLLSLFVPLVTSSTRLLAIFAGLNVVGFGFVWVYVREVAGNSDRNELNPTNSLSLEELFYIFRWDTRMHIEYQWKRLTQRFVRTTDSPRDLVDFNAWASQEYMKRKDRRREKQDEKWRREDEKRQREKERRRREDERDNNTGP